MGHPGVVSRRNFKGNYCQGLNVFWYVEDHPLNPSPKLPDRVTEWQEIKIIGRTMLPKSLEFSSAELQAMMKFLFLQKKTPREIHESTVQILNNNCLSYSAVKKLCANFQHGDFETKDAARSGRPLIMPTPEIVKHVHYLILTGWQVSAKTIAETLEISREYTGLLFMSSLLYRNYQPSRC